MSYLTNNQILNYIEEYTNDEKSRYAVLIDGDWGSGKTFFVKQILIPYLENKENEKSKATYEYIQKKIIYVSLYGISSIDDIIKQIWLQTIVLKQNIGKMKPFVGKASVLTKSIVMSGLSYFNINPPEIDYEKLIDFDKYILCFDDLERCSMNINEVLGYINNFVEHDGVKTIIVANENEIGKLNTVSNLELKYLLAIQQGINFPDKHNTSTSPLNTNTTTTPNDIDIKQISSRINYLFGENLLYSQIKEKVIGFTISYKPQINEILDLLVDKYICDPYLAEQVILSKPEIYDGFKKYNCANLRTLIFSFEKYRKIGHVVKKCSLNDEFKKEVLKNIFIYCFNMSMKLKQGESIPTWSEGSSYGTRKLSTELWSSDYIFGFKFIDDFILDSFFDESVITNTVERYHNDAIKQGNDENESLKVLKNSWFQLEDNVAMKYISDINEKLKDNIYDFSLYTTMLSIFVILKKVGLPINVDETLQVMKQNIKNSSIEINISFDTFGLYIDEYVRDEFNKVYTDLREYIKITNEKMNINSINSCFDSNQDWSGNFYNYVYEYKDKFISDRKFFYRFDIEKLFNCLASSNSSEITNFRQALACVYNFTNLSDYYEIDYNNVNLLLDNLNDSNFNSTIQDVIKKYNLKLLKNQLNTYLTQLAKGE